jgi:5-enolpyruvylshikimate-3-phosphate synthase
MNMKGFNIPEAGHVAVCKYPISMNGIAALTAVNLADYSHVDFIIAMGATNGNAVTYTLNYGTTSSDAGTAMAFNYYAETTADTDILGARTAVANTGFAAANNATSDILYVISVDASEVPDGNPWLHVVASAAATTTPGTCIAVLSGSRYAGAESPTVIS